MQAALLVGLACWAAIAAAPAAAGRTSERPLPAFTVTAPDGKPAGSAGLSQQPRWVLVYVAPGCRPCDRLLGAFKDWSTPEFAARTVLLVNGPVTPAASYIAQRLPPEAGTLPWYADAELGAWKALQLRGAPVVMGIESGEIKWTISGVLNDPASLESVVRSWVEY